MDKAISGLRFWVAQDPPNPDAGSRTLLSMRRKLPLQASACVKEVGGGATAAAVRRGRRCGSDFLGGCGTEWLDGVAAAGLPAAGPKNGRMSLTLLCATNEGALNVRASWRRHRWGGGSSSPMPARSLPMGLASVVKVDTWGGGASEMRGVIGQQGRPGC